MADVEMTDAPTAAPVAKKKGGAAPDGEGKEAKKRFEIKKVCCLGNCSCYSTRR
jgi:RING-box protein 1